MPLLISCPTYISHGKVFSHLYYIALFPFLFHSLFFHVRLGVFVDLVSYNMSLIIFYLVHVSVLSESTLVYYLCASYSLMEASRGCKISWN